jgi:hypothetical protein
MKVLHVLTPLIQMNVGFVLLCSTNDDQLTWGQNKNN